jgi:mevalonate kinase
VDNHLSFFSHGKLLITGEYFILDGAHGLALPTQLGQKMEVQISESDTWKLEWNSYDVNNNCWLKIDVSQEQSFSAWKSDNAEEATLLNIIKTALQLNVAFLKETKHYKVSTHLEFPNNWGLGSSSTLINNVAQWANVDAFELLELTFGGSGYDIAVAQANASILFHRKNENPEFEIVSFNPSFKEQLYFIHLDKKQNSREGIAHYKQITKDKTEAIKTISDISEKLLSTSELKEFETLLDDHENIAADFLQMEKVKDLLFGDYWGAVKSLGAWGGDFVLATSAKSETETLEYFQSKGFGTILKYKDIIFAPSN